MTQREEFEKLMYDIEYCSLEKSKLGFYYDKATALAWQVFKAAKATSFTLPDRMDYDLEGDTVIDSHHNTFADGYNQALSDVIAMNEE